MIKFRAWIKTGTETYDYVKPMTIQQMIHSKESTFSLEQLNDLVDFEQFTGLKDVNGKEIYEGDILKTKAGLIQIVEQGILASDRENIISGFYANNLSDDKPHTPSYDDEVIGNVHENPELLEVNK